MWDRDIPLPTKSPRWDFASAEVGCSMAFETRPEADKFAGALRKYARANDEAFGAEVALDERMKWRVWVVKRRIRKSNIVRIPVVQTDIRPLSRNFAVVDEIVAQNVAPSTDTDEDIMLSVDTRKGSSIIISKQPEARPVEVVDEITPTGRRKRRGKEG